MRFWKISSDTISGVDSEDAAGGARPPLEFGGSEKGLSLISSFGV